MTPPIYEPFSSEGVAATPSKLYELSSEEASEALNRFCQFLQFETVSSLAPTTGAYKDCAAWLKRQLEPLFDQVFYLDEAPDHSPVVVAVWRGIDESLPVLLLNSHYDVVPASDDWTVPPFQGLRKDGKIYGRGTQDMKCVCMQYIEALRIISKENQGWKPARSIYLTFVPDEGEKLFSLQIISLSLSNVLGAAV